MITSCDRILIAVPDLAEAIAEYQQLLGARFWRTQASCGDERAWLGLPNVVLELQEKKVEKPTISGLIFTDDTAPDGAREIQNARALTMSICDGSETARFRREHAQAQNPMLGVDHLVLRTGDADACVNLFSLGLGIRLALDKSAPNWGGRMLFYRVGKLTLEIIEPLEDKPETDFFWGIAYQCSDISSMATQLCADGVTLSEIREGRKPGTKVATVKSHSLAIPTLLLELDSGV